MEAILGLIKYDRGWTIYHRVGHFLAPVGWEAVHEQGAGPSPGHQRLVDLKTLERGQTGRVLPLLAHADPAISIDRMGPRRGFHRVVREANRAAARLSHGPGNHQRIWLVAYGRGDPEMHARDRRREGQ